MGDHFAPFPEVKLPFFEIGSMQKNCIFLNHLEQNPQGVLPFSSILGKRKWLRLVLKTFRMKLNIKIQHPEKCTVFLHQKVIIILLGDHFAPFPEVKLPFCEIRSVQKTCIFLNDLEQNPQGVLPFSSILG